MRSPRQPSARRFAAIARRGVNPLLAKHVCHEALASRLLPPTAEAQSPACTRCDAGVLGLRRPRIALGAVLTLGLDRGAELGYWAVG